MNSKLSAILLSCLALCASAAPVTINFDSMAIGSIAYNGTTQPSGWTGMTGTAIRTDLIQSITNLASYDGANSWRLSNQKTVGSFSNLPFTSPHITDTAGVAPSGATYDTFEASLYFKPASSTPDGSMVEIDIGSSTGDDRTTILYLEYTDTGVRLRGTTLNLANGVDPFTTFAADVLASQWQRLSILATFGPTSGTVGYYLNGGYIGGTTTLDEWRAIYRPVGPGGPYIANDGLLFRTPVAASTVCPTCSGTLTPAGFLIDQITMNTYNSVILSDVPEPASGVFTAAGLGLLLWLLRRNGRTA